MARTTVDVYQIHVNYGQGWEYECAEFTHFYARQCKRDYIKNVPQYPVKIVKKREKKTNYDEAQLASIQQQIEQSRKDLIAYRQQKQSNLPNA